jgi:hypothetical protein
LHAQWKKETQVSFELNGFSEVLPQRGIAAGPYYTGSLNVLKGQDENELVVKVKVVTVTPRANTFRPPETPEQGVLFCEFFEKPPVSVSDEQKAAITIPAGDQGRQEVQDGEVVKIKVPDHASYVALVLRNNKARKHEVALFDVSRPYRTEAMQQIKERRAREGEKRAVQEGKQVQEVKCKDCDGTGKTQVPEKTTGCERCNGSGWYPPGIGHRRERCGEDGMAKLDPRTKTCGGSGRITIPAHDEPCETCRGRGKVRAVVANPLLKN